MSGPEDYRVELRPEVAAKVKLRVMGVDPGLETGVAVLEGYQDKEPELVEALAIKTNSKEELGQRILHIHTELGWLAEVYTPAMAAIETIFVNPKTQNYKSALTLGHARAAALLSLTGHRIATYEFSPSTVKRAATGHGNAKKELVAKLVAARLNIEPPKNHNAADAVAIALALWNQATTAGGLQAGNLLTYLDNRLKPKKGKAQRRFKWK